MKSFMAIYCVYDPDNYWGHRILRFEAEDMDKAEIRVHQELEVLLGKGRWEYQINEVKEEGTYRIYNTKTHKRE